MRTSTHIPKIEVSPRFRLSLTVDDQGAWRVQHDAASITILESDEEMLVITRSHMRSGIVHVVVIHWWVDSYMEQVSNNFALMGDGQHVILTDIINRTIERLMAGKRGMI